MEQTLAKRITTLAFTDRLKATITMELDFYFSTMAATLTLKQETLICLLHLDSMVERQTKLQVLIKKISG
jgi:hypothetical protein